MQQFWCSWRHLPSKQARRSTRVLLWDLEMPERQPFVRWESESESCLLWNVQRFLGRGHEATAEIPSSELPQATVNSVTVYGQPKYLVLLDTDITTAADGLTPLQVSSFLQSVCSSLLFSRPALMWSAWCMTAQTQGNQSVLYWKGTIWSSGALNTVRGSICDTFRPPNCQFWSSQTRATREWLGRTTYYRSASDFSLYL